MKTLKKGDTFVLKPNTAFWRVKTQEELETERMSDVSIGRYLDDAGESILYSPMKRDDIKESTFAVVVRTKGIEWLGWNSRPKYLIEILTTIQGIPQYILVKRPA
jgi:hypothetical protein